MNFKYFWRSISVLPHLSAGLGLLLFLLGGAANAALVEVLVSGSTDNLPLANDLSYIPGGTFSASFIYDTSFTDTNPAPEVGTFNDFSGNTALISVSVSTNIGTVEFDPENVVDPVFPGLVGAGVTQLQLPFAAGQSVATSFGATITTTNDGFNGSLTDTNGLTLQPNTFAFELSGSGPNNYFFTDPNILFSGISELSIDAETLGGVIQLFNNTNNVQTLLTFGASDFTIREISVVPIPTAIWLFGSALGLLGWMRRKTV